ncbi:phosphoribosylanthranilate isomerase [Halorarius litoreus]|uniref:phosphoribosylanthranilate isomerase n=1 Tax=Halorarius litoreus TaxID=2962676 RepID=UPI0020CBCC26|nr:phosphoribosylanthranilate isomerase [Halorarius litoreus]
MVRAKVCGLTREADVQAAVDAGADAVGFIVKVDVDTPREISPARAEELVETVPPFVTSVLVTMPDTAAEAVTLAELVGADAVQTHDLSPQDCTVAAMDFRGPVIPAVSTDEVAAYAHSGDALLVDTPSAEGGGGTGCTHDWNATRDAVEGLDTPVILAGGLTSENVTEAIETVQPFAVDVASGVESEGGVKDHDAVRAFVARAQEAQ